MDSTSTPTSDTSLATPPTARLPEFLIIGAQKSATTWLHFALRAHPDVFMPRVEVPFFEDPDYQQTTLAELAAILSEALPNQVAGIKRPGYLSRPECGARIAADLPNAKCIMILRNPVNRAISALHHMMKMGSVPVEDSDKALSHLLDTFAEKEDPLHILSFGLYSQSVERFMRLFPSTQLKILFFEDVVKNPQGVYRDTCEFLGVDPDFVAPNIHERINTGVYEHGLLTYINLINRVRFKIDRKSGRLYERTGIIWRIFAVAIAAIQRSLTPFASIRSPISQVSPLLYQKLRDFYLPDIEKLEGLTGKKLDRWKILPPSIKAGP